MVEDCLFCGIVARTVPASIVWEDDAALAFEDLRPQAPTHVLVIPKTHHADLIELAADPQASIALLGGIRAVAQERQLADFRTVFNTGAGVGQSVFHVHAHVLAGRAMSWPPG